LDRGDVQRHFPAKGSGVLARDVRDPSQSPRCASHRPSVKESIGGLSQDGGTLDIAGAPRGTLLRVVIGPDGDPISLTGKFEEFEAAYMNQDFCAALA